MLRLKTILLTMAVLLLTATVHAHTVYLLPDTQDVLLGTPASVELWMDFTTDPTLGGRMSITYDDSRLSLLSFDFEDYDPSNVPNQLAPDTSTSGLLYNLAFGTWNFDGLTGPSHVATIAFNTLDFGLVNPFILYEEGSSFTSAITYSHQVVAFEGAGVNVVPEPATIALLLFGGLGLAGFSKKKTTI